MTVRIGLTVLSIKPEPDAPRETRPNSLLWFTSTNPFVIHTPQYFIHQNEDIFIIYTMIYTSQIHHKENYQYYGLMLG